MWLEHELLSDPSAKGFFCVSTSYRQEPNPVEGRHETIFPMFEFEFPGDVKDLEMMEKDLLKYLGLPIPMVKEYNTWCGYYGTDKLDNDHEEFMGVEFGSTMITNFPNHTSPFWNMKQNGNGTAAKIDVILGGMETIGSAERSTDIDEMSEMFHTISDGGYAQLLFDLFGKERVEKELQEFLKFDFVPRVGGGIGVTRMISAMAI